MAIEFTHVLKKDQLPALLGALAAQADVYVPGVVNGSSKFVAWQPGVQPRFDLQNTKEPCKELLFPATEHMYRWKIHEGELTIEQAAVANAPFVVFGARPCDVAAIERLDNVFLTKGYVDEFYEARRNAAMLVALTCTSTGPACFCTSMGQDPNAAPGADIVMRESADGSAYLVASQTDKGAEALKAWEPYLASADGGAAQPAADAACTLVVDMTGVHDKLHSMFDDPIWQDVANTCLTCGTCTFVCPTCHCFDITQDTRLEEGGRFRCWDSCMYSDYTMMAGGHNPRAAKSSRVRQRFMHKLCYFEDRYGEGLCVGCGRCVVECPAGVDITRIIERIGATDVASGSAAQASADAKEATVNA